MVKHAAARFSENLVSWFRKRENILLTCFLLLLLSIFYINTLHESYPDEFDNILGGWYLIHGLPIYSAWFSHHGPVPYFIAAVIELFGGNSFVNFRKLYSLLIFAFTTGTYLYLRHRFSELRVRFYLGFLFFLAILGNYYWLHMLLADNVSAYLFLPVFALLLLTTYYKKRLTRTDLVFISVCTALGLLSSLTYLFLVLLLYGFTAYRYFFPDAFRLELRSFVLFCGIMAAPYVVFFLYLVLTASLNEFLYQAVTFNQKYYAYTYPGADKARFVNPIRFALTIMHTFYNNYFGILQQVTSVNIYFPLNITMAIGSLGLIIYLFFRRYFSLALFTLGMIIFANTRSNPLTSGERDYQSAVYILLAFFAISFLLSRLPSILDESRKYTERILLTSLLGIVGFYTMFSTGFLLQKFFDRSYQKYMGTMSLIYDRPHVAPIINNLVVPSESVWMGPFLYEDLFYTKAKLATKYHVFLPAMGSSPKIQEEMVRELSYSRPEVIWFHKNFHILGRSPEHYGQFIISYIDTEYVSVGEYVGGVGETYKSRIPVDEWIDIETRLYIRKDVAPDVIKRMLAHQYIQVTSEEQ